MPHGAVKTKHDEKLWNEAKVQVSKEYPNIDKGSDRYWSIVMGIYKKMKG